jgi:hypothetical protein
MRAKIAPNRWNCLTTQKSHVEWKEERWCKALSRWVPKFFYFWIRDGNGRVWDGRPQRLGPRSDAWR